MNMNENTAKNTKVNGLNDFMVHCAALKQTNEA